MNNIEEVTNNGCSKELGNPSSILVAYTLCTQEPAMKMTVMVEPSFLALGPFHMAVGINDRCWIYEIRDQGTAVPHSHSERVCVVSLGEVFEKSYLGNVTSMELNTQYAAALYDGHILLHTVHYSNSCPYIPPLCVFHCTVLFMPTD